MERPAPTEQTTPNVAYEELPLPTPAPRRRLRWVFWVLLLGLVLLLATLGLVRFLSTPPASFPLNTPITIESGTSVVEIARTLKTLDVVRSEFFLYAILVLHYEPTDIKASTYVFTEALTPVAVAEALTKGNYAFDLVRFTHREGMSVRAMAPAVHERFPQISIDAFIEYATEYEGELFPETYLLPPDITLTELVAELRRTYRLQVDELLQLPRTHELSESDIIIIASILEREANSPESMQEVANILLRRLSIDMPLQVDASIEYILDKPLGELLPEDLRQDSPYNTYTRFGLPPTPIGNPGAVALRAVINATTATPYLFYITGNDGNFYYGRDFDEHRLNIARHLR